MFQSRNKIFRLIISLSVLLFFSCTNKPGDDSQRSEVNATKIGAAGFTPDTANASITLERVKLIQPESHADSLYRKFIFSLINDQAFKATLEHLKAYQSYFNKTPGQKVFAYMKSAEAYSALARYDSSIKFFSDALQINIEAKDSASAAECEHNIGYNLQFTANIAKSLGHIYNALQYYEQKNDTPNMCLAYYDIAEVHYQQNNFEKTLALYKQCYDFYLSKSDTLQMAQMLDALSDVQNKLNNTDIALEYSSRSLALWKYLGDLEGEANCLNTIAGIYKNLKKWNDAITYYKKSYALVVNTEFQRPIPVLTMNLGVAYLSTGNLPESEKYLLSAIEEFKKAELYNYLMTAYKHAGELYKRKGVLEESLKYFERFDSLKEVNNAKKSTEEIATLNIKYESAKKENEIISLSRENQEAENRARIMHYIGIIVFLVLTLVITLVVLRNTRTRHRLQKEKSEKELELSKAKLKHEFDKKLMDDFAQRILDKNKLITDLEKKIKSAPGFNSSAESAKKSLEELSKLKILTSDDWDKFQMNYNKVFPGSIKIILTKFSDLTESELRMFLLIKLDIRIREVASVLGISQESVRKTRYRMRKKLSIGEEDDLDDFVKDFSDTAVEEAQV